MPTTNSPSPSPKPAARSSGATRPRPAGLRVLCVDDHELLVEGLRAHFGIDGTIEVVGSLSSADHLLDEAAKLKPDLVLLDIEMPGADAFEAADRLKRIMPNVRVVFLSAHVRDGYITAAYKCHADGYFAKGDDLHSIVAGLHAVAHHRPGEGAFVMGPKVRERCLAGGHSGGSHSTDGVPQTALSTLSEREVEVLRLIGKGLSRTEIATELSRSAKTIDGHQDHIMKKLGIASRADLVRFAIREGLVEA